MGRDNTAGAAVVPAAGHRDGDGFYLLHGDFRCTAGGSSDADACARDAEELCINKLYILSL